MEFLVALVLMLYGAVVLLFIIHIWLQKETAKQKAEQRKFLLEQWRKPWY